MPRKNSFQIFLVAVVIFSFGACRSPKSDAPEGLVVVNAPVTGKVRRVLVSEGMDVPEKATLIEIEIAATVSDPAVNVNRQSSASVPNQQVETKNAEDELQRASVELQRIEPLVAANNAPQAHLDAARAQYQQAQEKLDRLRRQPLIIPPISTAQQQNSSASINALTENVVAVAAPSAGNVRVIGVRSGQSVKAGQPVATIAANR